jgi:hypothetical protein
VDASRTSAPRDALVAEQAALRRVATLVARAPAPDEVFAAVTRETGELLGAQRTSLLRIQSPERAAIVAGWSRGAAPAVPVGHTAVIDGRGILGQMLRAAAPVRIDDFDEVGGAVAALMRRLGIRSAAAGPIVLGGHLWGALTASWPAGASMPAGAEDRVAAFAELVSLGSRTPRPDRSWRRRARDSWRRPTRRGDGSSATCTTARSSGSWRPRSSCRSWSDGSSETPTARGPFSPGPANTWKAVWRSFAISRAAFIPRS